MIMLIVDDHVFRLRQDGIMESGKVTKGHIIGTWGLRSPEECEMTGMEYNVIERELKNLACWYPENRPKPPKPMVIPNPEVIEASDIR